MPQRLFGTGAWIRRRRERACSSAGPARGFVWGVILSAVFWLVLALIVF